MTTITITIDDELLERFRATSVPEEDFGAFMADAARARLEQREHRWQAARAEAQAILNGPRRPLAEADAEFRLRHGLSELTAMTPDERADEAERILAAMDPKVRAEMEREGLL